MDRSSGNPGRSPARRALSQVPNRSLGGGPAWAPPTSPSKVSLPTGEASGSPGRAPICSGMLSCPWGRPPGSTSDRPHTGCGAHPAAGSQTRPRPDAGARLGPGGSPRAGGSSEPRRVGRGRAAVQSTRLTLALGVTSVGGAGSGCDAAELRPQWGPLRGAPQRLAPASRQAGATAAR